MSLKLLYPSMELAAKCTDSNAIPTHLENLKKRRVKIKIKRCMDEYHVPWKEDGTALTTPTWHTVHTEPLYSWPDRMDTAHEAYPAISETCNDDTYHTALNVVMVTCIWVYRMLHRWRTDCAHHTTACEHQQDCHCMRHKDLSCLQ